MRKLILGQAFVESLQDDLRKGRRPYIFIQRTKWEVVSVSDKPVSYNPWQPEYEVAVQPWNEKDEQLSLF